MCGVVAVVFDDAVTAGIAAVVAKEKREECWIVREGEEREQY